MKAFTAFLAFFFSLASAVVCAGEIEPLVIKSGKEQPIERAKDVRDQLEKILASGEMNVLRVSLQTGDNVGMPEEATIYCASGKGKGNDARILIIFPDDKDVKERMERLNALRHDPTVRGLNVNPFNKEGTEEPAVIVVFYLRVPSMTT